MKIQNYFSKQILISIDYLYFAYNTTGRGGMQGWEKIYIFGSILLSARYICSVVNQ